MELSERDSLLEKIREIEGEQVSAKMSNGTLEDLKRCVGWLLAGKPWVKRTMCDKSEKSR
jgi:hypothetical protein